MVLCVDYGKLKNLGREYNLTQKNGYHMIAAMLCVTFILVFFSKYKAIIFRYFVIYRVLFIYSGTFFNI